MPDVMPETHPLIETVTEPLAKNVKQREAANEILGKCFVAEHPDEAETMARLEGTGKRRHAALWSAMMWILALLALAVVVLSQRPAIQFAKYWHNFSMFDPGQPPLPAGLSEQELLLVGDPSLDELEQKRQLHLSDPDNPAYFTEYAMAWSSDNGGLPPDYFETAARIAPDNAYFLFFAAAQIGGESIERKWSTGVSNKPRLVDGIRLPPLPRELEYEITDRTAYEEALELIAKATELPGFGTYTREMMAARTRLLPGRNLPEFFLLHMHAYGQASGLLALRKVTNVMCARAEEISKNGSKEGFIKLAAQRDAFLAGFARNHDIHLIGELIYEVVASDTATNFHAAADRLGLVKSAEKYHAQAVAFHEQKDRRTIGSQKNDPFLEEHGLSTSASALMNMCYYVNSPPPLSASELKPMRMVEHEFAAGLGVFAVAMLMLVSGLLLFLFRFLMPRRIRVPASRMARVLGAADWCRVLLLGVALPIVLFLIITRLTPLGGREHGFMYFELAFPGVHFIALWLGLLLAPAMVMRSRLARRLAPFGFTNRKALFSATVLALVLVMALAAYPLLVRYDLNPWTLGILAVPAALAMCRLTALIWRCFFAKPTVRVFKTTTAIAVLPAYPVAIIALCLTLPINHVAEERWLAKETLIRIDPEAADLGAYEFKVAAQKRRELNAIMGFE